MTALVNSPFHFLQEFISFLIWCWKVIRQFLEEDNQESSCISKLLMKEFKQAARSFRFGMLELEKGYFTQRISFRSIPEERNITREN